MEFQTAVKTIIFRCSSENEVKEWIEAMIAQKFPCNHIIALFLKLICNYFFSLFSAPNVSSVSNLSNMSPPSNNNSNSTTSPISDRRNLYSSTPATRMGENANASSTNVLGSFLSSNVSMYGGIEGTSNQPVVPIKNYEPPTQLQSVLGWSGLLSRKEAQLQLRDCPQGTFLIRWSTNANSYVLSFKKGREVLHIGSIKPSGNGTEIIVAIQNETKATYPSLLEYVEAMKKNGFITLSIHAQTGSSPVSQAQKEPPKTETIYESLLAQEQDN